MPDLLFQLLSILDCAALVYTYCAFQLHQVNSIDVLLSSGEESGSAFARLNPSLVMEPQNEKTPRELEENEESSPFLVSEL